MRIRRRDFITLLGGGAAWPLAARAQQPARLPTIGFVGAGTPSTYGAWVNAFVQRLHELGRVEGRNIAIEYRWAQGRNERYAEIAAEFARAKVDVIVAASTPAALAAQQATAAIPIVFVAVSNPIGAGLVANLARPAGNLTGLSNQQADLAGKRVGLLHEVVPGLRRLAIMGNVGNPANVEEIGDVKAAAQTIGFDAFAVEIRRSEDITPAFDTLKGRADALYVASDPLINSNRVRINTLALSLRLPTLHTFSEYVEVGGLMSYGPSYPDMMRRAGDFVDMILRGTKPADIPVEQPTKFDLVINLTTAKVLGLTVPPALLATADEVIE
jgi:putative ABC transport system substrate-binding protein